MTVVRIHRIYLTAIHLNIHIQGLYMLHLQQLLAHDAARLRTQQVDGRNRADGCKRLKSPLQELLTPGMHIRAFQHPPDGLCRPSPIEEKNCADTRS